MMTRNRIEAAYRRSPPETETPPVVGATEGASIAVGANAQPGYSDIGTAGKRRHPARKTGVNTGDLRARWQNRIVAFRGADGRLWCHGGKRGMVLEMLATMPDGVTQWDCLPWHTRLGASICVLRELGLSISTTLEGDWHHARYHLLTPGSLTLQGGNGPRARHPAPEDQP